MRPRRSDATVQIWVLAVLVVAAFVISTGYGVTLPRLSALLARTAPGNLGEAFQRRHVAGLTAAFFGAALVGAPIAGAASDRLGRRVVLSAAGLAFSAGFLGAAIAGSVLELYGSLALAGLATGIFEPVALALVADQWSDADARARRFAWVNGAVRAGYLAGPLIGELAGRLSDRAPFLLPATVSTIMALALLIVPRGATFRPERASTASGGRFRLAYLLTLSATAAGGVVALEVAFIAPLSQATAGRGSAALLLTLCGAVMLFAQVAVFAGRNAAGRGLRLLRPLLIVLAAALVSAPFAHGAGPLAATVAASGTASAALTALAGFLVVRASPAAHGRSLGVQYAAVSAGQMLAAALSSSTAGAPYALWISAAAALFLALIG